MGRCLALSRLLAVAFSPMRWREKTSCSGQMATVAELLKCQTINSGQPITTTHGGAHDTRMAHDGCSGCHADSEPL